MKTENDARCDECISIGVECPEGYTTSRCVCDICSSTFILVKAECHDELPSCRHCGGQTSILEIFGPDDEE